MRAQRAEAEKEARRYAAAGEERDRRPTKPLLWHDAFRADLCGIPTDSRYGSARAFRNEFLGAPSPGVGELRGSLQTGRSKETAVPRVRCDERNETFQVILGSPPKRHGGILRRGGRRRRADAEAGDRRPCQPGPRPHVRPVVQHGDQPHHGRDDDRRDGPHPVWNPNRFKIPSTWVFRNEFWGALSPRSSRTHERSKNRGKRVRFDGGRDF